MTDKSSFVPEPLHDEQASAALVYLALFYDGPATKAKLVEHTGRSERTVRNALQTLDEHGLLDHRPDIERDVRRYLYQIPDDE